MLALALTKINLTPIFRRLFSLIGLRVRDSSFHLPTGPSGYCQAILFGTGILMELHPLTDLFMAAPQLEPGDLKTLADDGVTTVICNRPDVENPPELQAAAIQVAAEAAGLTFVYNPVNGAAMTMDNVEEQGEAIAASEGAVVAYCASGMRSAVMWGLSQAGNIPTDQILEATQAAGYPMAGMRAQIDSLAAQKA